MVVAGGNRRLRQIVWQFVFLHERNEGEGSAKFAPVESFASATSHRYNETGMENPNENPRRHRWPWLVLAAFLLGVSLAVLWISFEVRKVERERDVNAPLPASPAH
jgi:hypothetical protein